jgi:hypothetical protein
LNKIGCRRIGRAWCGMFWGPGFSDVFYGADPLRDGIQLAMTTASPILTATVEIGNDGMLTYEGRFIILPLLTFSGRQGPRALGKAHRRRRFGRGREVEQE